MSAGGGDTPQPSGWGWGVQVAMKISLSQPKANWTIPCPLAGAGEHKQLWHSPTPDLKPTCTYPHAELLKLMGTHSQVTFPLPSWSKRERPAPYTLQQSSQSPRACTIHTGNTSWLADHGVQGVWCSWAPLDCNNWKDHYWQATPPRALQIQQIETQYHFFLGKKAYLFTLELYP